MLLQATHLVAHHGQPLPRAHLTQLTRVLPLTYSGIPLIKQGVGTGHRLLPLEGRLEYMDARGRDCAQWLLLFGHHVFKFCSYNYKLAFKFKSNTILYLYNPKMKAFLLLVINLATIQGMRRVVTSERLLAP